MHLTILLLLYKLTGLKIYFYLIIKMIIHTNIDIKYSTWVCHEIGLCYFKIRKLFTTNEDEFQTLYSICTNNAIKNYNSEIIDIYSYYADKKEICSINTYILDRTILENALLYIWAGSYSIVTSKKGSFIIIAFAWNYYLVIEPMKLTANEFMKEALCDYIIDNYNNEELNIIQYTNTSKIISTSTITVLNT